MIKMEVKVSVVIPCYNCGDTISTCVKSVMHQSYPVLEIILINDGSTDTTSQKLTEIQEKYKENKVTLRVFEQENQGPSVARNKGIAQASGDWVAFLDSDDYWFNDTIELLVKWTQVYAEAALVSGGKGLRKYTTSEEKIKVIRFRSLCFKNYFLTSSTMVKAHIAKNYQFNIRQKHSEDYRFFLDILSDNNYGIRIDRSLSCSVFNKRDYGESGLSQNIWKMEKGELSNFKHLYNCGKLSYMEYVGIALFSILKYLRRWIITNVIKR